MQNNMNSLSTFIQMFENFLSELTETFPNHKQLKSAMNKYELIKGTNNQMVLDTFVSTLQPYQEYITTKDERLMTMQHDSGLLKDINITELWNSPECTKENKDAIWAHLSSLFMFASTIRMIPQNLMSGIEQLAQQYASSMDENSFKDFKPEMLMNNMSTLMNNLK